MCILFNMFNLSLAGVMMYFYLVARPEPGKFDLVYQNSDGSERVEYAVTLGSQVTHIHSEKNRLGFFREYCRYQQYC